MMRILLLLSLVMIPAFAQRPLVRVLNASRPDSGDFQIGDRFEVVITGAPNQPVSVRTIRQGRIDWGPIIGSTDSTGRWSVSGQFSKEDFGDWGEVWTVGGKLASPPIQISVNAPCVPGGQGLLNSMSMAFSMTCETAEGRQPFATPSSSGSFRTPDGRVIAGRAAKRTVEQYDLEMVQSLIEVRASNLNGDELIRRRSSKIGFGDNMAKKIAALVGSNALDEQETRNSLAMVRAAFARPEMIEPLVKTPSQTLPLLQRLADITDQDSLKREIAETIAYVQAH